MTITNLIRNHHSGSGNSRLLAILVVISSSLLVVTATTTMTTVQMAYAQNTSVNTDNDINIQSAPQSSNAAHTGSISVEVQGEDGDTPAHRGEITHKLPNDRTKERVVESAPQSSGAAASAEGSVFLVTIDISP